METPAFPDAPMIFAMREREHRYVGLLLAKDYPYTPPTREQLDRLEQIRCNHPFPGEAVVDE